MTPNVRQWIYTISAIATALIPLLVVYKVLDPGAATAWINIVGILGALGSGGAATAAVVIARQRKEGTLDFTGTAAEQAIAAIQATVSQASTAAGDLDRVKTAVTEVLGNATDVLDDILNVAPAPGPLVAELINALSGKN
jgi:hypothetical protein